MKRALALAGVFAYSGWYLSANRDVLQAVVAVVAAGLLGLILVRRLRALVDRRQLRSLGDLLSLTPPQFEAAVANLLARSGYRRVRLTGGPADLGADIVCLDRKGRTVVVQCKRHAPGITVGSAVVQRFLGAVTHHRADQGILVTTSRFSGPALELAAQHDIELIDGEALARMSGRLSRRHPQGQPG